MAHVEGGFIQVNERLAGMERRLDRVDHRFESLDRRFDAHERSIALRFDQVDRRFNWLTGIVLSGWITTILTILFHR
jgi:hypothetical protein